MLPSCSITQAMRMPTRDAWTAAHSADAPTALLRRNQLADVPDDILRFGRRQDLTECRHSGRDALGNGRANLLVAMVGLEGSRRQVATEHGLLSWCWQWLTTAVDPMAGRAMLGKQCLAAAFARGQRVRVRVLSTAEHDCYQSDRARHASPKRARLPVHFHGGGESNSRACS